MGVQFRVLGDVAAHVDGRLVDVGHARQRCVLLALLVDANRVVPADRLVDRVWAQRAPQRARGALYNYVSRLRQGLAGSDEVAIARRSGGYVLTVDPLAVDLHLFQHLTTQARAATDDEQAAALFAQALGLWHGEAFGTLDTPWLNGVRNTANQWRTAAELDHADVELRRGRHGDILADLASREAALPLDERLAGQHMLALHRSGRQAEALDRYRRTRSRLAEELGIDPGAALQALHQQILTADPVLDVPAARHPRQLPAPPRAFTGRASELARLNAVVADAPIVVVSGTAGVGKTTLAVHWAHRAAARFPDGQLYLDLRGFGPDGEAVPPEVALRWMLEALGVPARAIPAEPVAQAALYRSTMSGRRILVVLDNARDAAQVRPLLPGSATALVVATSRDRLLPLVAAEGAVPIAVDLPSAVDARRMLVGRAGPSWAGVDPDAAPAAVDEIVARCARLPLALTVAAARAATGPGGGPDQLAEELRSAAGSLDAFDVGDPGGDVRAVFFWSYATLSEPAARLFRQLGVHPGPDVSAAAAAALAGAPPAAVRGLLRELTRASLLTEHRPGRFACHDLLRTYADELAAEVRAEGNAALHRVLDHYLHTAHAATLTLNPSWEPLPLDAPAPGSAPTPPADTERALAWYSAELSVLVAAVNQAHAAGLDTLAWRLAWTLTDPLEREGEWVRWADVHRIGLSAARRLGDRLAQAQLHRGLGRVSMWQGHYEDATDQFHRALRLFTEVDHVAGQARVWHNLCQMYDLRGDHAAALDCGRQSLRLSRQTGDRAAIAKELNAVGWCLAGLGDLTPALRHCEEALELWQQVHDTAQEAATWDSVGYIHHQRGQFEAAVACFRRGAALNQEVGDRFHAAHAMVHSGDSLLALNEPAQARQAWREAEQILADLAHPWRSDVAARLTALDRPAP